MSDSVYGLELTIASQQKENERLRAALEKICGRREYDQEDFESARNYKRNEGLWEVDEYLADAALGDQQTGAKP